MTRDNSYKMGKTSKFYSVLKQSKNWRLHTLKFWKNIGTEVEKSHMILFSLLNHHCNRKFQVILASCHCFGGYGMFCLPCQALESILWISQLKWERLFCELCVLACYFWGLVLLVFCLFEVLFSPVSHFILHWNNFSFGTEFQAIHKISWFWKSLTLTEK